MKGREGIPKKMGALALSLVEEHDQGIVCVHPRPFVVQGTSQMEVRHIPHHLSCKTTRTALAPTRRALDAREA